MFNIIKCGGPTKRKEKPEEVLRKEIDVNVNEPKSPKNDPVVADDTDPDEDTGPVDASVNEDFLADALVNVVNTADANTVADALVNAVRSEK